MVNRLVTAAGAALACLLCWAVPAQAQIEEAHPEWFESGKPLMPNTRAPLFSFGQIHIESAQLGSEGVECVWLSFGSAWDEGNPRRPFGQVLDWSAGGHVPEETHKKLSAACRPQVESAPGGFMTDEAVFASEESESHEVEPGLRSASTPWNLEVRCGAREEEFVGIVKLGVPTTAFPGGRTRCPEEPTQEAEEREIIELGNERTEMKGCYASIPAPAGCIRLTIVEPAAGLEVAFGGTLYWHQINGVKNGLSPTKWKLESKSSGELQCEFPAGCSATAVLTGQAKVPGYSALQLLQVR